MAKKPEQSSLRIIAGQWRGRKLSFPVVDQLRPTGNRVRETLFNWLQNDTPGEHCLDLFAGSGACGLEALSRGASRVTFIERNGQAAKAIKENLELLGSCANPVICTDALNWLAIPKHDIRFGIVFLDPPFADRLDEVCCNALESSGLLKDRALITLESGQALQDDLLPPNWRTLKTKQSGNVNYALLERRLEIPP